MHCVLVADDLTGACDSAVQFRMCGASAVVHLNSGLRAERVFDVDAFTTETRGVDTKEMEVRILGIASRFLNSPPDIVFKKIDSVLRGNPGTEIMTALNAFGCDVAIITSAFPDMGRRIRNGHLFVFGDGVAEPLNVLALLQSQGLKECIQLEAFRIGAAIRDEMRYLSLDAACNSDLWEIVQEGLRFGRRVLWAGSGGLAAALARVLFSGSAMRNLRGSAANRPILFCIGSDHPVTCQQLVELKAQRAVCSFDADSTTSREIAAALERREHVMMHISRGASCDVLKYLLCGLRQAAGGVLLSGGDTASLVCRALGVHSIEIEGQVISGLPVGVLRGGCFEGMSVATKSGGFGDRSALVQVTDFFRGITN